MKTKRKKIKPKPRCAAIVHVVCAAAPWKKNITSIERKTRLWARSALVSAGFGHANFELAVLLSSDADLQSMNGKYRGKNKPTNVLSFPAITPAQLKKHKSVRALANRGKSMNKIWLGDVAIAWKTVSKEARTQHKTLSAHTAHLVIHGVLHLLGYDHMRGKDANAMERIEKKIMRDLGFSDPYAQTAFKN